MEFGLNTVGAEAALSHNIPVRERGFIDIKHGCKLLVLGLMRELRFQIIAGSVSDFAYFTVVFSRVVVAHEPVNCNRVILRLGGHRRSALGKEWNRDNRKA